MPHTPGPWTIEYGGKENDDGFTIASKNAAAVEPIVCERWPCTVITGHRKTLQADATLIAAAPQMLSALQDTFNWLRENHGKPINPQLYFILKSAICTALGQPSE